MLAMSGGIEALEDIPGHPEHPEHLNEGSCLRRREDDCGVLGLPLRRGTSP